MQKECHLGHWVYFLEAVGSDKVKIGYTSDLFRRYKTLQTGCPLTLNLWGAIPASKKTEKHIHKSFVGFNSRHTSNLLGKSEWFYIKPYLVEHAIRFMKIGVNYVEDTHLYATFGRMRLLQVNHFGVNVPTPIQLLENKKPLSG